MDANLPIGFLKESVKRLRCIANRYARKIIEEVKSGEGYATTYRLACDMLGVRDSVEVAILVAKAAIKLEAQQTIRPTRPNTTQKQKL
jgi:hypothetical protein